MSIEVEVIENTPFDWLTLYSHLDPQDEWGYYITLRYNPIFAYDGSTPLSNPGDNRMAMSRVLTSNENKALYGHYWSGWLELYLSQPTYCSAARAYYHMGGPTGLARTQIEIRYDGDWHSLYDGQGKNFVWHTLDFSIQLTEGIRIRFERQYLPDMNYLLAFDVYEMELYGNLVS